MLGVLKSKIYKTVISPCFAVELEQKINEVKAEAIRSTKNSLVNEFSAEIAHDINNPLSIITMHLDRLEKHAGEDIRKNEKASQSLEKINLALERIQGMTTRLGEVGRKEVNYSPDISLKPVIEESVDYLGYKIKPMGINVSIDMDDAIKCYGNANSLKRLFSNLISNACDAMENSSEKKLILRALVPDDENTVLIEVRDTGEGISNENLDQIFTRFFTSKKNGMGAGLGLSTCCRIIKDHGGDLHVKSDPGKGTSFFVSLNKEY